VDQRDGGVGEQSAEFLAAGFGQVSVPERPHDRVAVQEPVRYQVGQVGLERPEQDPGLGGLAKIFVEDPVAADRVGAVELLGVFHPDALT